MLPEDCETSTEPQLGGDDAAATLRLEMRCSGELVGRSVGVRGLTESGTEALLRIELADGRRMQAVLRGESPSFSVPERQRPGRVAREYLALGFRHILEGPDHLLFVLGLVLLVPVLRMLFWTITCFTLGHSITLSLATLGFLGLPPALTEFAIAASILVVAVELAHGEQAPPSLLRRTPWALAVGFGLLHGLGFAGALAEIGLPQEEIPLALFGFNVGIELGQLAFVGGVLAALRWLRPLVRQGPAWLSRVPAYGIGSLAAYWCFERAAAWLGSVV